MTALVLSTLVYLVVRAAEAESSSWPLIMRGRTTSLMLHTVGLAAAVTLAATAIGVVFAWLAVRSDLPGRRMWATLFALPLVIPSYVGAFTLLSAFGPTGLLQQALEPLGVQRLPDITGFWGAFLALTLFTYPYVYLVAAAGIRGLDPAFEEAGRVSGRSRSSVFRRVTLPLLRPSIGAGALLVALYTLHDFGAVSLMRYPTFTQAIFLQYKAAFDRTPAAILSLILAALALLVVAAERRARGRARYFRSGAGSVRRAAAGAPRPLAMARPRGRRRHRHGRARRARRHARVSVDPRSGGRDPAEPHDHGSGRISLRLRGGSTDGAPRRHSDRAAQRSLPRKGLPVDGTAQLCRVRPARPRRRARVRLLRVVVRAGRVPIVPLLVIAYVVMFLPQTAEPCGPACSS